MEAINYVLYDYLTLIVYVYTFIAVLAVSLISLAGIFTLSLAHRTLQRTVFFLVSVSVGALFADVFFHILPESFEATAPAIVSTLVILGILIFFVLEKFLSWKHEHGKVEESGDTLHLHDHAVKPVGTMVLVSDALHNMIDGVIIAASFAVNPAVGIASTVAILLHELPHEIADYGLLIHAGFTKKRALFFNFVSALTAFLGAALVFLLGAAVETATSYLLPIAAGGFIYIAGSDLVPELQKNTGLKASAVQLLGILLGVVAIALLTLVEMA
ncbi:MAG: hypothetical protein A2928_04575 [Candidatus Taylorbacteria bacterium RIFCSPLOWO2_01_FULL_45_15b]|uniref:ZIP family metal transporter n=1 Tax=Candidatus Taylorbacteria bacterium RIFCSPLOWO2_01_FULL_45_15b TaxID=1802319 RepID=A0A1G2NFL7_9BACT|nr:MAG: hypothetical protein A2928_04575 [Candidatus Taylorbacteria bacterium RIFCSPLOWO2_01_FULL_45_15b]